MMQDNCKEKSELLGERNREKMLKEENDLTVIHYWWEYKLEYTLCVFGSIYENLKCVYSLTQ